MANTTARGYGHRHQQIRKQMSAAVASGTMFCTRCRKLIRPWEPWDLDHSDDRARYLGPAHRSCNRRAGAQKRNAARGPRRATSRAW